MDADLQTARIEALRHNLSRYARLLTTYLTETERAFVRERMAEDRRSLETLRAPPAE